MEKNYYKLFLESIINFITSLYKVACFTIIVLYILEFWFYYMWQDAYKSWSWVLSCLWWALTSVFHFLVGLFN